MWWYVVKRLLQTIPVFLGATLIIFVLLKIRPGDPILNLAGNKPVSQEVRDALAAQYHIDDPLWQQWLFFVKHAITLDFGNTFAGKPSPKRASASIRGTPCASSCMSTTPP